MTLKSLPTTCFPYNPEENSRKLRKMKEIEENEAKQYSYEVPCASSIIKCLENIENITSF